MKEVPDGARTTDGADRVSHAAITPSGEGDHKRRKQRSGAASLPPRSLARIISPAAGIRRAACPAAAPAAGTARAAVGTGSARQIGR